MGFAQESRTYTCGPDCQPVDLAFGSDGEIYSTDGQLLERESEYLKLSSSSSPQVSPRSFICRHDSAGCTAIAEGRFEVFGLTTTQKGDICASFTATFETVRCWNGQRWQQVFSERNGFFGEGHVRGRTTKDLLAYRGGFWLLRAYASEIEQRFGITCPD